MQRKLELGSRAVLLFSHRSRRPGSLGTAGLSVAKILENMEIGHNVLHGQWDWMRDPKIHSTTWEWDSATPAALWKHSHNELHHTFTNVSARTTTSATASCGSTRTSAGRRPTSASRSTTSSTRASSSTASPPTTSSSASTSRRDDATTAEFKRNGKKVLRKVGRQAPKDYLLHPLLSRPVVLPHPRRQRAANFVRNVWTHSVIMCGHFPDGVETFARASIEGESRGEWYLRQMLGSANISGSKAMHIMTGNLSHQIEHHLFPDLPSNRYARDRPAGAGDLRALRPDLHDRPAATSRSRPRGAGRLAVAAQRDDRSPACSNSAAFEAVPRPVGHRQRGRYHGAGGGVGLELGGRPLHVGAQGGPQFGVGGQAGVVRGRTKQSTNRRDQSAPMPSPACSSTMAEWPP